MDPGVVKLFVFFRVWDQQVAWNITHTHIYIYVYTRIIFNSVTDLLDTGAIPKINPHNYALV